ncbi:MAG: hypothetical protein IPK82_11355 [Polyangiaceae bacterium]|nr:hypothetical protein [Polyangiaceae bacterium]
MATSPDSAAAARALAREVYTDEAHRPRIDDATARVLAGDAPAPNAPPKLTEIADLRAAIAASANETASRRLLQSLGADLGAAFVIAVSTRDNKPVARVLNVATGAFLPIELTASLEPQPNAAPRPKWTEVPVLLAAIASKSPAKSPTKSGPVGPVAPKKDEPKSFWTSPWTWAGVGVVVAAGVIVFAVSQTQNDGGGLRLQGRVSP